MEGDAPLPSDLWVSADARHAAWKAEQEGYEAARRNKIHAGDGLGMNPHNTIEQLDGAGGSRDTGLDQTVTFDVWENGVLVTYDVPASNRRIIGTFP